MQASPRARRETLPWKGLVKAHPPEPGTQTNGALGHSPRMCGQEARGVSPRHGAGPAPMGLPCWPSVGRTLGPQQIRSTGTGNHL